MISEISVDFLKYLKGRKFYSLLTKSDTFFKAIKPPALVFDATAGLGKDLFFLLSMKCEVIACDQSKELIEQLQNAFLKLKDHHWFSKQELKLKLICGDSIEVLKALEVKPDVVYIDTMFPEKKKSSLPKKEIQILQSVIGKDQDALPLLDVALKVAKDRVIIKRPVNSSLVKEGVTHQFCGKVVRFDMYKVKH